jgi:hypothetical protein
MLISIGVGEARRKLEELSEFWTSSEASPVSYTRLKEVAIRIYRTTCACVKLNERCEQSSK